MRNVHAGVHTAVPSQMRENVIVRLELAIQQTLKMVNPDLQMMNSIDLRMVMLLVKMVDLS